MNNKTYEKRKIFTKKVLKRKDSKGMKVINKIMKQK